MRRPPCCRLIHTSMQLCPSLSGPGLTGNCAFKEMAPGPAAATGSAALSLTPGSANASEAGVAMSQAASVTLCARSGSFSFARRLIISCSCSRTCSKVGRKPRSTKPSTVVLCGRTLSRLYKVRHRDRTMSIGSTVQRSGKPRQSRCRPVDALAASLADGH